MNIPLHCPICGTYEGIKKLGETENYFCNNCKEQFSSKDILDSNQDIFEKIAKEKFMETLKKIKLGG